MVWIQNYANIRWKLDNGEGKYKFNAWSVITVLCESNETENIIQIQ